MRYVTAVTVLALAASLLIPPPAESQLSLPPVYIGYTVGTPWVSPSGSGMLGGWPYCNGTSPNGTGGISTYCPVMANVAPNFDYVIMPIRWVLGTTDGMVDTGIEGTIAPTSNPPPSTQYTFMNLDARVFTPLTQFTCATNLGRPHPCWFALQLGPMQAGNIGQKQVPDYVYNFGTGTWADTAAPPWTAGTTYYTGQTVTFGGSYYTLAINVVSCTPTGVAGPTSDGCTWGTPTTHAPPLDVAACGFPYQGSGLPANAIANINSTTCSGGQCLVSQLQTGVPAIWENPAYVSEVNAWNALMGFINTKTYAQYAKYARMGLVTDGTTYIECEDEASPGKGLDTLVSSSGTASTRMIAMESLWTKFAKTFWGAGLRATKAAGITFDANFACNSTTCDTNLAASAASTGGFIGILGLEATDITNWYAGNRVTNGWTTAFSTYSNVVAGFHMQQIGASNTTTCALTVTCMQYIYPFVSLFRQVHPIYLEIYASDMRCAFDSTWVGAGCASGAAPYQPWANTVGMLGRNLPAPSEFVLSRGH